MAASENATLTALCMIYDGNKILLQDRLKEDWRGLTFPGGHVEEKESFVKAIIREIMEETGLTIQNPQICGIKQFEADDGGRYVVLLFKANQFSGQLTSSEEGKMVWVDRNDLEKLPVAKGFFDTLKIYDDTNLMELIYEYDKEIDKWVAKFY
jgi:8-oxo-dGTP diphosphatase